MKSKRQVFLLFVSLSVCLVYCTSKTESYVNVEPIVKQTKSLAGIYTLYTKGNEWQCETIKHYFELKVYKRDSSFLYHAFCHPDNNDPTALRNSYRPRFIIGKWTIGSDSLVRLQAFDGEVVKLSIHEDGSINTYKESGESIFSYFDSAFNSKMNSR